MGAPGGVTGLPSGWAREFPGMNPSVVRGEVRHNAAERRFEIETDGRWSVVDYELADGRIILTHTFVPPELRGRGLAEKLVRAALRFAQAERLTVVPACSYVAAYLDRHPEFCLSRG
jgi:predicted GNAT family acetyltransferase